MNIFEIISIISFCRLLQHIQMIPDIMYDSSGAIIIIFHILIILMCQFILLFHQFYLVLQLSVFCQIIPHIKTINIDSQQKEHAENNSPKSMFQKKTFPGNTVQIYKNHTKQRYQDHSSDMQFRLIFYHTFPNNPPHKISHGKQTYHLCQHKRIIGEHLLIKAKFFTDIYGKVNTDYLSSVICHSINQRIQDPGSAPVIKKPADCNIVYCKHRHCNDVIPP